jgi:CelD/BcsL family acetyltransferase involved in cellulose biosynthesis
LQRGIEDGPAGVATLSDLVSRPNVLTTIEELEALAPEWSDLWDRCPGATTFQRPEWLVPWLHLFRPESLWTVEIRSEGRLAGLVPLFLDEDSLYPVGAGITDYLDALIDREAGRSAVDAFYGVLRDRRGEWSTLDFEQLRPLSPLFEATSFQGLLMETAEENASPVLTLPESGDLHKRMSTGHLKNLRYARRQMERAGKVEWVLAGPDNVDALLDALFRTHAARWGMRGEEGMLMGDEIQSFHRQVARGLLQRGVLRLYGLRFDGRLAGALESFFEKDAAYFYLHGFEPEVARFSPGLQLVGRFIDDAVERGIRRIDFLRGREAYKYRWGAKDMPTYRRRIRPA